MLLTRFQVNKDLPCILGIWWLACYSQLALSLKPQVCDTCRMMGWKKKASHTFPAPPTKPNMTHLVVPPSHHWHISGSMEKWRKASWKGIYTTERQGSSRRPIPQQKAACAHVLLMSKGCHRETQLIFYLRSQGCHEESPITAPTVGLTLCSSPWERKACTGASRSPAVEQLLPHTLRCGAVYRARHSFRCSKVPAIEESLSLVNTIMYLGQSCRWP